jgi:DNA-binding MarR family transcriptional regulator
MSSPVGAHEALLRAVRTLYDAVDAFDVALAGDMGLDRTALRAVNAMEDAAISPGELGRRLHLASGSVTALLDRLERAGHIERHLSASDRRRRDARLTQATHRQAGERYEALAQALRAAFADADDRDLARVTTALEAVATAFTTAGRSAPHDN